MWLLIPPNVRDINVAAESKDPNSLLNFYKRLLSLRRTNAALRDGDYSALPSGGPDVLSFLRKAPGGEAVPVVLI
jgi:alpha-glucosidase